MNTIVFRMIYRVIEPAISKKFGKGKAIVLIGPRQVGKTTLLNSIIHDKNHLFLDGDDPTFRNILQNINTKQLKTLIGNHELVFIDEAQHIENIGLTLKLITDQFKNVQLLVSGSSAFEIKNLTNEPLTGRKWQYYLFPISWEEFEIYSGHLKAVQQLEQRILYGMYPDVITNLGEETEILKTLSDSYLYKDILAFHNLKKPEVLEKLMQALAYQIGQEVSYNELSQLLGIDKNTVSSYIDILSNNYVIFKLPSFSKNLRNEIKRKQKIYFYDNGMRNAIINDFRPLDARQDKGALWENFLISERVKRNTYHLLLSKSYFWRTTSQQEIDYIEVTNGAISAYEIKWNEKAKVKIAKAFEKSYDTKVSIINKSNFINFLNP
ncbi:ATP-binding protein [Gelidibacter algens]|uniref:ATP-binding protein n=1 Tax=Gelidibacter algens TaxID=49280 RepID=UPI001FEA9EDB|nr:ATP-binding protein [Gelidibacter algens]